MPLIGRLVIFIYNLLMLAIAGIIIAVSLGWSSPLAYLNAVLTTPMSNLVMGAAGIVLAIVAFIMLLWGLKTPSGIKAIVVESGEAGEVSISIAATKAIIMRAIRQVEGVRELRPTVIPNPAGLTIKLHVMLNPEYNVPETSQLLQGAVRDQLEKTGGLQVAEIKVLVDEFNPNSSK
jgi:uncharacterized alkaline shock family protein YloU